MKLPLIYPKFLNRFTSLPVLLDILQSKHLVLLDPETWEDRNDAYYIERYKAEMKLKSVLALCFSMGSETFHHWKVFSAGISGVCIEFNRKELVSAFEKNGMRCGQVSYKRISALEESPPKLGDWPYLKRRPFKDEQELRVIYEDKEYEEQTKAVKIKISSINRITLSPWMPTPVTESVIKIIHSISECGSIKIFKSSLLENFRWKKAINPKLKY